MVDNEFNDIDVNELLASGVDVKTARKPRVQGAMYLLNTDLYAELQESHRRGAMTTKLAEMFQLLAARVARGYVYVNSEDRQDCIAHAVCIACLKWQKFDMTRDNPFSYFTSVVFNGLRAGWNAQHGKKRNTVHISLEAIMASGTASD